MMPENPGGYVASNYGLICEENREALRHRRGPEIRESGCWPLRRPYALHFRAVTERRGCPWSTRRLARTAQGHVHPGSGPPDVIPFRQAIRRGRRQKCVRHRREHKNEASIGRFGLGFKSVYTVKLISTFGRIDSSGYGPSPLWSNVPIKEEHLAMFVIGRRDERTSMEHQ